MKNNPSIDMNDARLIIDACIKEADTIGIAVSIAILDNAGHLIISQRMDGAAFQTPEVAKGKALTSVMMKKPSGTIETLTLSRPSLLSFSDGRVPIQGALPVLFDTKLVGAVGVSGGTPEQDESITQAGIDAFFASL